MALLRDLRFIQDVTTIPALADTLRDAVIQGIFLRDDPRLPKAVVHVLTRAPHVTARATWESEVGKVLRIVSGEEGTQAFGALTPGMPMSPEDMHYYRRALEIQWESRRGVSVRPSVWTVTPDLVPLQGGVQLDLGGMDGVEIDGVTYTAQAQVGARWKAVYERAKAKGMFLGLAPVVPLDYCVGDAVHGDARFVAFRGDLDDHVNAVRAISADCIQVTHGFTRVPNHSTAYDLRYLATAFGADLAVVTSLSLRLQARPPVVKNVAYSFVEAAGLASSLEKILNSGREMLWLRLYDDRAWALVHPKESAAGLFVLEAGFGGREAIAAVRAKAIDGLAAGNAGRAEVPSHLEAPSAAYAKAASGVGKMLVVGELLLTSRHLPKVLEAVQGIAAQRRVRSGFFAAVTRNGQVSLFPFFEAAKEMPRVYDLSRALWDLQKGFGGEVLLLSRLAHFWSTDKDFQKRVGIVQKVDDVLDPPNVVEPVATLEKPSIFFAQQ